MKLFDRLFRNEFGAMESAIYRNDIEALASFEDRAFGGRDRDGTTVLMVAINASDANVSIVKLIIDRGCDVSAKDSAQWTALHFAARNQNGEIVALLLQAGASVNERNSNGNSPLLLAISKRSQISLVSQLLEAGANPALENENGVSPMSLAMALGREDLVSLLSNVG